MIRDSVVPKDVLARIGRLTQVKGGRYLHIIQSEPCLVSSADSPVREFASVNVRAGKAVRGSIEPDEVLKADCVSFLEKVAKSHPEGLFDLAFADPPYNLQKLYGNYDDALAEHRYIEWCNQWLDGMARSLKPGGSLFVLNLPRWAIHHAAFLNKKLEFRHWIAWDALSDPRGKIMPAHYALLWYTRPGVEPKFNYVPVDRPPQASSRREPKLQITEAVLPPDAPNYCLRSSCVRKRKARGDDDKVDLSDVWFDIHRIKHKRDRDAHPCQLPERLMERIIRLSTNPGDWVFDPFCGAGTTAVSAAKLGRRFVVTDIDSHYVRITMEKLAAMKENARVTGDLLVPRTSVRRPRAAVLKREVEVFLQGLARELGRVPTEQDLENTDASLLQKIDTIYPNRGAALKRARIALAV
jgi:site-specific DNA-methyltransferase (adenine-specific)